MKSNEFLFEIYSSDGKKFVANITELNVVTKNGHLGILKSHYPLVAFLDISTFNIVKDNVRLSFAVSGACLHVTKEKSVILADTFESEEEIDKERVLKKKEEAQKRVSLFQNENNTELISAERSLKKALNRLSLLK